MRGLAARVAVAVGVAATWCAVADANGRPPATSSINFQQDNSQHIVAGMTFGVLFSSDGGHTWRWLCEAAFPYSGTFDPVFVDTPSGALFATTIQGLRVMRDGCTAAPVAIEAGCDPTKPCSVAYVSNVIAGKPRGIYATRGALDSRIYHSGDDGHTFEVLSTPGLPDDYWQSFVIAPSNPKRIYLSGYRFTKQCDDDAANAGSPCKLNANCTASGTGGASPKCTTVRVPLLLRSDDGGATWSPMAMANLLLSRNSAISVVGVDPTDANQVYIHVNFESGASGDGVYKSSNAGGSGSDDPTAWAEVFHGQDPRGLVMLVRSNGALIAATEASGTFSSPGGARCFDYPSCKWTPVPNAPHINCLSEQPDTKDIWACTHNYGNGSNIPGDGAGIMKTSDLATWTPMLKFADIAGPVTCGSDSPQAQQCVAPYKGAPSVWCCLVQQLGITSTEVACTGAYACKLAETSAGSAAAATTTAKREATKRGCCNTTGETPAGAVLLVALTLLVGRRRRR